MFKLEKLRTKQENLKRRTEKIEEAYSILMTFQELTIQTVSDIRIGSVSAFNFIEKSKEMYNMINRLHTLIGIFMSPLKDDMKHLNESFDEYWEKIGDFYDVKKSSKKKDLVNGWDKSKVDAAATEYFTAWKKLEDSLEKLAQ